MFGVPSLEYNRSTVACRPGPQRGCLEPVAAEVGLLEDLQSLLGPGVVVVRHTVDREVDLPDLLAVPVELKSAWAQYNIHHNTFALHRLIEVLLNMKKKSRVELRTYWP